MVITVCDLVSQLNKFLLHVRLEAAPNTKYYSKTAMLSTPVDQPWLISFI